MQENLIYFRQMQESKKNNGQRGSVQIPWVIQVPLVPPQNAYKHRSKS